MPYNLLLLPLLGGFLFVHLAHYFRFGAPRLDGYRLLFQSALAGIVLSAFARLADLAAHLSPLGDAVSDLWHVFSPFDYSGISALSLIFGPVLALLMNLVVGKRKAMDLRIREHGNSILKLLHRAEEEHRLVSITLDTRKWYVGWVVESPNLDPQEMYFRMLPFISGYREKDSLQTVRSVFYQDVLSDANLEPGLFYISLPLKDVKIAGLFNDDVYNEYFAGAEESYPANPDVPVPDRR